MTGPQHQEGLVDTNIVILHRNLDAEELPERMLVSAITIAELAQAPHFTDDPVERAERIAMLAKAEAIWDPLPFDDDAAHSYARVVAGVLAVGRKPRGRVQDLMIAAVAHANDLPLYTTNPDDFKGLEGLVEMVGVTRPQLDR
ncbi:type II toxin-antitoxin system VapC family toxin [Actinomadura welshii]